MDKQQTTIAKSIDATQGQHPQSGERGLYDSAAKSLVSTRYILAWIAKFCVQEASGLPLKDIATKYIEPDVAVSATPVYRDDAEAEDPGRVRQEATEDASTTEGVVRYDILFTLKLPGEAEPVTVIVNVELQNRVQLDYPLISRGMSYVARLLGQQGPNYNSLHKVYSVWIVSNPEKAEENTVVRYSTMKTVDGGAPESPGEDADLMEVCILNLGEPQAAEALDKPTLLDLLDILFSKGLEPEEKKKALEKTFGIPMTKKMEGDMETMRDSRYGFEVEAEQRGIEQGIERGRKSMLYDLVRLGRMTVEDAAQMAGLSPHSFEQGMKEHDYTSAAAMDAS